MQFIVNGQRFAELRLYKKAQAKKPPDALPQREAKNQAEHYEEDLLGGITPGGS